MAENDPNQEPPTKKPLRVLAGLTFLFALASALCGGWWKFQRDKARDELVEAASRGAWEKYQAALRNDPPALDWLIASLILLLFAIAIGATTLLYWTITRRRRQSPGLQ